MGHLVTHRQSLLLGVDVTTIGNRPPARLACDVFEESVVAQPDVAETEAQLLSRPRQILSVGVRFCQVLTVGVSWSSGPAVQRTAQVRGSTVLFECRIFAETGSWLWVVYAGALDESCAGAFGMEVGVDGVGRGSGGYLDVFIGGEQFGFWEVGNVAVLD